MNSYDKDLVVLVPDNNMSHTIMGILSRPESLNIRQLKYDIHIHVERDPGCFQSGHDFLRPMINRYKHGLLLFDKVGSGQESKSREVLEQTAYERLKNSGWDNRAEVIILDPELEAWVWSDSPEVDRCLGWSGKEPNLRKWMRKEGLLPGGLVKPDNPKTSMEQALRHVKKIRSSAIYHQLAASVSFNRCTDPAFHKFKTTMFKWFGLNNKE